jgi:hypothetical protein
MKKTTHQQLARNTNTALHDSQIQRFVAERDAALLSLDEHLIRAHMQKWGVRVPADVNVFWMGIHKARTACRSLPREARLASKAWLSACGCYSFDGGELEQQAA